MSGRCVATRLREPMSHSTATTATIDGLRAKRGQQPRRVGVRCASSVAVGDLVELLLLGERRGEADTGLFGARRRPRRRLGRQDPARLVEALAGQRSRRSCFSRLAPPTCRRCSSRVREHAQRGELASALGARVDGGAPASATSRRSAPARSRSPPASATPTSSTSMTNERERASTTLVRPVQPVATTRSWWRRWRSWRLARRVPMARDRALARRDRLAVRDLRERGDDDPRARRPGRASRGRGPRRAA